MQKYTPPEVFLRLALPNLFLTGADEAQVSADRFFFRAKASEVLVTTDQFFCVWRDWKFLRLARPKYKCQPTEVLFLLDQKEHKWLLTKSF